jgi:hypothetical protein
MTRSRGSRTLSAMATLASVEPSSTTSSSQSPKVCANTLRSAPSSQGAAL